MSQPIPNLPAHRFLLRAGCIVKDSSGLTWRLSWPLCSVAISDSLMEIRFLLQSVSVLSSSLKSVRIKSGFGPFPGAGVDLEYLEEPVPCVTHLFIWKSQLADLEKALKGGSFPIVCGNTDQFIES